MTSFSSLNSNEAELSPLQVWQRQEAVYRKVWALTSDEVAFLDRQFLRRTTAVELDKRLPINADILRIGPITYQVEWLNCSHHLLGDSGPDTPLVLSFRLCTNKGFAAVIVQPRWSTMGDEKYNSIRSL